jgi:hypothetical protein
MRSGIKPYQIEANDKQVIVIARLMGIEPALIAKQIEQAIDNTEFTDKEDWMCNMDEDSLLNNGTTIRELLDAWGDEELTLFNLARKARIPSFDVRMTDALQAVEIHSVGDCPECGEFDLEATDYWRSHDGWDECHDTEVLMRCPCCGFEDWM